MKRTFSRLVLLMLALSIALPLLAQEAAAPAPELVGDYGPSACSPSLGDIVFSSGLLGVAIWIGLFVWALAALPLGILSIVHSTTSRTRQFPLATKLVIIGCIWTLLLGLSGFVQGTVYALQTMACVGAGSAQQALLALNISHALYSFGASLLIVHIHLVPLLVSLAILHVKHRSLQNGLA